MPALPQSQGHYRIATRNGEVVFTAGMTPRQDGVLLLKGPISAQVSVSTYQSAVELAVDNALHAVDSQLGGGEQIAQVLNMVVYVAADEGFAAHSRIADLASDHLFAVLGEAGIGSRTAVGVYSLPGHAPVEISLVVAVRPG